MAGTRSHSQRTTLTRKKETKWQSLRQLLIEGEQRGDADYDLEHFIHALDSDNAR